jgi:lichenan operon transcriptional antiterminator
MNEALRPLYSREVSLVTLLRQAWWHQNENFQTPEDLLRRTTQQFIDTGVADQAYQEDILHHEELSTYAVFPGIVLIYSLVPTNGSQLSITTLEHRMTWNSHKVRIVVAAALTEEDMPVLLQLTNFLYEDAYDYEVIKNLKTKEEILAYVRNSHMLHIRRP